MKFWTLFVNIFLLSTFNFLAMSKVNAAQTAQEQEKKVTMTIVEPAKERKAESLNLQAKAEDVSSVHVVQEKPKMQTIEDIKRKSEVLTRLSKKYDDLQEKRKRVENFQISHDTDSASVQVYDANGEAFESHSPKTIGKLIQFWMEEFTEAIAETEKKMREIA